jgi:hypothetical protein
LNSGYHFPLLATKRSQVEFEYLYRFHAKLKRLYVDMDTLMNETELKVSCQGPFQKFSIEA